MTLLNDCMSIGLNQSIKQICDSVIVMESPILTPQKTMFENLYFKGVTLIVELVFICFFYYEVSW